VEDPTTPKLAKTTENARSPRAFSFCGFHSLPLGKSAGLDLVGERAEWRSPRPATSQAAICQCRTDEIRLYRADAGAAGGTASISLPLKTGVECGLPSGDPPACSIVTA
jgi:hypothetical protein